jgi:malonyl-CoA/methylmalonyl-CoA synthetase
VLTQANLVHDARNIIKIWEITDTDVLCHALPLFHIHGLCFALHTALMAGAAVILLDAFRPKQIIDVLSRKEGLLSSTVFMAVPAMYNRLFDALSGDPPDFSHLRLLTSGSAPLLPKDFHRIKEIFGKEPVEREGMSETGMNFSNPLHGKRKPGTIGLPLPGLAVKIMDPVELIEVAAGEIGEIWLKGRGITPGYWGKKEETEKAFVDGWFRTGDLGNVDDDGYYCITDRLKHIIITGGENVSPKEIESVINQHDAVNESCVVGVPDEKWGEIIAAAIRLKPDATTTAQEIKDHCRQQLLSWKCPKTIVFVDEIPRNTMGKVLKEGVKRMFLTSP